MAVVSTAIVALGLSAAHWPVQSAGDGSIRDIAFWVAVTIVVSAVPVRVPRGSLVSVSIAPILAAAILDGPTAAGLVAAIGSTELRELRRQIPWYGSLYNHAIVVIPAVLAGAIYRLVTADATLTSGGLTLWAAVAAGVVYPAVNELLGAAGVACREGRTLWAVLGRDMRTYGLAFFGLAPLSWLMALAYITVGPIVVLLFALPLYTTRASYQGVVEIRKMFTQTVRALASAIDARDESTMRHSDRVSSIAMEIGQVLGVGEAALEQLEWGGLLHDIGKIGVPDAVLLKPGRLDRAERIAMNKHPEKGAEILQGVEKLAPELPLIPAPPRVVERIRLPGPARGRADPVPCARTARRRRV